MFRDLSALRHLAGLSAAELAAGAEVSVAELLRAESAPEREPEVVRAVTAALGLHRGAWAFDVLTPADDDPSIARFFTFRGPFGSLDGADVSTLLEALRCGRDWAARACSPDARLPPPLPVVISATYPTAAAQQGYRLARRLRHERGLGSKPVPDLVSLAAELGIPVLHRRLRSSGLRAVAVMAADRSAAAAVIAEARPIEPRSARVDIAHEICHILYDSPAAGGTVLTLDTEDKEDGSETKDLAESRAKGFAAELLVPLQGLIELFGPPDGGPAGGSAACAERVRRVVDVFKATVGVAQYQLVNQGYLPRWATHRHLVDTKEYAACDVELPPVDSPSPGCAPLPALPGEDGAVDPLVLAAARGEAMRRSSLVSAAVSRALAADERGRPREGAVVLAQLADDMQYAYDRELAAALVREVSARALRRPLVRAVLLSTVRSPWPVEGRAELVSWFRSDLEREGPLSAEVERWLERLS
jgi:Zn-dependent peptidase ImmA (M78 family)